MLVCYGANPAQTDVLLWGSRPPVHVAAANGQLLAMKWLVEECHPDIHVESETGGRGKKRNLIELLQFELDEADPVSMRQAGMAGHAACFEYVILAGVEKRRISEAELTEVRVRREDMRREANETRRIFCAVSSGGWGEGEDLTRWQLHWARKVLAGGPRVHHFFQHTTTTKVFTSHYSTFHCRRCGTF